VGFEVTDRCRHCGYEFTLMSLDPAPETRAFSTAGSSGLGIGASAAGELSARRAETSPLDLPLVSSAGGAPGLPAALLVDPQPLPARAPLAVRRTAERRGRVTPAVVKRPRPVLFDAGEADATGPGADSQASTTAIAAPVWARVLSALVDVSLLAAIDGAVVYLTMQIAGVSVSGLSELPFVPLAVFVLGLNLSYLAVFTANGGQTLGKMAMGLRVEGTDATLTFGAAMLRVAAQVVGAAACGAGFLPVLWRPDGRAVHDHIAHTRVVRVTA